MTTGAPNTAVTVPRLSSVGEKSVRATRSHKRQKAAPITKHAGTARTGFEEASAVRAR